jgi:hypothetical protein
MARPAGSVDGGTVAPSDVSSVAAPTIVCAMHGSVERVDDNLGKPHEYGTDTLENLRVLRVGATRMLTWERQTAYSVGDASRTPWVAASLPGGGERAEDAGAARWSVRKLAAPPVGCAASAYVGLGALDAPIVTWGQGGVRALQAWSGEAQGKSRSTVIPGAEVLGFAASDRWVVADLAHSPCGSSCECETTARSVWLFGLAASAGDDAGAPVKHKVATLKRPSLVSSVPAVATSPTGGVVAYRDAGALYVARFDASGHLRPSERIDDGDVGAPAVSVFGESYVVVWAKRARAAGPYALWAVHRRMADTAPFAPALLAGTTSGESMMAPTILLGETRALLAWSEGDAQQRGRIQLGVWSFDATLRSVMTLSTASERNARDPELAGTVDAATLAYSAFSPDRPGGVARVVDLTCGAVR